jgi:hypothetical protein
MDLSNTKTTIQKSKHDRPSQMPSQNWYGSVRDMYTW